METIDKIILIVVTAFLVCLVVFGSSCQQNVDKQQAEVAKACINNGGTWVHEKDGNGSCIK